MNILVLDGNENQAVACVRSLARAGYRVRVGSSSSWPKAGWSRHSSGSFVYVPPQHDEAGFVDSIVAEVRQQAPALVLPMTEHTTLALSERRDEIAAAGGLLAMPSRSTILRAFDKSETTRLAESLGIRVPHTCAIHDPDQARQAAHSFRYPVVLKPRASIERSGQGAMLATGGPRYASTPAEFIVAWQDLSGRCSCVLVQEFVEGRGAGYFALMRSGEIRAEFAHLRIRDVRPTGSGSSVRVSVRPESHLLEAGRAILRELRWHGVAMVEFRLQSNGTPVFMEVNGRFWNSLPLAIYAGVDFPALLVRMVEHGDVPPCTDYRQGVRCRWLLGDFRHLVQVMRGAPTGYPGKYPRRLQALLDFLTPVRGTYHDNFTLTDPLPELGDWFDFLLRRVPAFLRGNRRVKRKH